MPLTLVKPPPKTPLAVLNGPNGVRCILPAACPPQADHEFGKLYYRGSYLGRVTSVAFRARPDGAKEIRINLEAGYAFVRKHDPAEWTYGEV